MPTQSWSWVNGTCFLVFTIPHSSIPPYEDVPSYTGSWHAWTLKSQYHQPILGQIHMSISTCVWWNMQTKSAHITSIPIQATLSSTISDGRMRCTCWLGAIWQILLVILHCLLAHPAKVFLIHIACYLISGNKFYFNQFLAPYLTIITTPNYYHHIPPTLLTQTLSRMMDSNNQLSSHPALQEQELWENNFSVFHLSPKCHESQLAKWQWTWTIISNVI